MNRSLLTMIFYLSLVCTVRADLGMLVARGTTSDLRTSLYVSPAPPVVGSAEVGIVQEDLQASSMIEAPPLAIRVAPKNRPTESRTIVAEERDAKVPAMRTVIIRFPTAGVWSVDVFNPAVPQKPLASCELTIGPAPEAWSQLWAYWAWPLPIAGLLVLRAWRMSGTRKLIQ